MQIDQQQQSTPLHREESETKKGEELSLVIFPKKFLNPLLTYRMNGDFHLYSDAKYIQFNKQMKIGISCQNTYKRVSKAVVDLESERLILTYTQLDFAQTPWEYVVKRLQSFGDAQMNELSQYIQRYYEQLNQGLTRETQSKISRDEYRASGSYQYRYIKELDQFFISQMHLDLQLIEDLGFTNQQFAESCLRVGIPEITLKPGCSNEEYFKNVMEFAKPLTNPNEPQDFYLFSNLYPEGLKATVTFSISKELSLIEGESLVNFNFYLNYTPSLRNNLSSITPKKIKAKNCISYYYDLMDHHYSRCGFKKTRLETLC